MPALVRALAVLDQLLETLRAAGGFVVVAGRLVVGGVFTIAVAILISVVMVIIAVRGGGIPRHPPRRAIPLLPRVEKHARRGFPVPARPPGFLVEALEGLGHAPVHDEADVLLVDAHAEGCGRDDDVPAGLVGDPFPLARDPVVG